jgi:hypothetical protein
MPRKGSRKETVYETFHQRGREAAIAKALELGLKEDTAKGWCCVWRRPAKSDTKKKVAKKVKAQVKVKAKAKAKAKKASNGVTVAASAT